MDNLVPYLPISGFILVVIGGLISVKVELTKRPTYDDADKRYKDSKVCDEIHKNITEKLECLPEIKKNVIQIETKLDAIIKHNNK